MASLMPLRDKIIVDRMKPEDRTTGGIVLPDTAQERPLQGTVIAVGSGRLLEDGKPKLPEVKKGDRVLFGRHAGAEVKVDGKVYVILQEADILAVLEGQG